MKVVVPYRCPNPDCPAVLEPQGGALEFWDAPVDPPPAPCPPCPACGDTQSQRLTVIHYDPPRGEDNLGSGRLACDPEKSVGHRNSQATGVHTVVNCPRCRESQIWQAADAVAKAEREAAKKK